jgi:hypothetical protein
MRIGTRRSSRGGDVAVAVIVAMLAIMAPATATAAPAAAGSMVKVGDQARDCVGETFTNDGDPRRIDFAVWCGVESGVATFTLERANHAPIEGFSRRALAVGRDAEGMFDCHRQREAIKCIGRKQGPVTIRGWITVESDARCAIATNLETGAFIVGGKPHGCPGTQATRVPWNMRHIRGFRRQFGLDLDLQGNRSAIDRRIRGLIRAWERGEPVARYTLGEWGVPLRAKDQRELNYRDAYMSQIPDELDRWVPGNAASTYAGYTVEHRHGGVIYIGFVGDQGAQLAAFLSSFDPIAPGRIKPFPVAPRFSERQLGDFLYEILESPEIDPDGLITRMSIATLRNAVEVGTEHVDEVRRLLAERFGPDAPFQVVYSRRVNFVPKAAETS